MWDGARVPLFGKAYCRHFLAIVYTIQLNSSSNVHSVAYFGVARISLIFVYFLVSMRLDLIFVSTQIALAGRSV